MKKHKILIFTHDAALYGASFSLLTLIEYLANDDRFEVMVLLPYKGKMETRLLNLNICFQIINYPHCIIRKEKISSVERFKAIIRFYRSNKRIAKTLKQIIQKFKPDLIYTNTSIVSIGLEVANKFNLPHVWHIREYGAEDFKYNYLPFQYYHKRLIKRSERVIFISKALKKYWVNSESSRFNVVYNGLVDSKNAKPFPKKIDLEPRIIFGIVGAILPGKGQDVAIKAFAQVQKRNPNVSLHIYGDTVDKDYYASIQSLIEDLGCKNDVHLFPFTDNHIIYSNLTVLLSCSIMEGLGRTIIEAMSCGIPVIANANGGPLELIKHGKTGLLYRKSTDELVLNMLNLIINQNLYAKISKNGIEEAYRQYDIESYVEAIVNIFLSTISTYQKKRTHFQYQHKL